MKKAKHFRIWLAVAGTGLEPVTFGLWVLSWLITCWKSTYCRS